jgi:hypothetical protein
MTDDADLRSAATPEAMRAALAARADEISTAAHPHRTAAVADVREAEYRGHRIEVRTSYAITVDRRPFDIHVVVDNDGRVFYHGLPTRDFPSVIALVQKAIDQFPDDFAPGADAGGAGHGHPQGPDHEPPDAAVGYGNPQGEAD